MTAPLMPKATAVWLVENTTLTFRQISDFCEIHELEIQAIADGDVASNIMGLSPIDNNQLTWEEIHRCEADASANLVANLMERNVKEKNAKAKKILSPSQRNDKPAAIAWIVKNYPMLADPTGVLSRAFGVMIEEAGMAYRGTFLVNPEGKIKIAEIHDNNIGRNADELLRKVEAAQFVAEHPNEVCPAKWKKGASTLKPSIDLVGKI